MRRSTGMPSTREPLPISRAVCFPLVSMTAIDSARKSCCGSESASGSTETTGLSCRTRAIDASSKTSTVRRRSSKTRAAALARLRLSVRNTESALVFACVTVSAAYSTNGAIAAATTSNMRLRRLAKGDTGRRQEERTRHGGSGECRRCLNHYYDGARAEQANACPACQLTVAVTRVFRRLSPSKSDASLRNRRWGAGASPEWPDRTDRRRCD